MPKMALALAVVGISLTQTACGDDGEDDGAGRIETTLSDFHIELEETSAPAGEVTFEVHNNGPSTHEFVVLQTDLAPDELTTDENGDVAEDELAPVDEIEDIEEGASPTLTVDLDAGSYVLICNIAGHYRQGMSAGFTVT